MERGGLREMGRGSSEEGWGPTLNLCTMEQTIQARRSRMLTPDMVLVELGRVELAVRKGRRLYLRLEDLVVKRSGCTTYGVPRKDRRLFGLISRRS